MQMAVPHGVGCVLISEAQGSRRLSWVGSRQKGTGGGAGLASPCSAAELYLNAVKSQGKAVNRQ